MAGKIRDIKGEKYGMLTVVEFKYLKNGGTYWLCKCDCGNEKIIRSDNFISKRTKSCGCLIRKHGKNRMYKNGMYKHGMSKTRLYKIWICMKQRCFNTKFKYYYRYGGRGITIFNEWKNSFETFMKWAYNNGYKEDLSIDRINNNGNYEPENCRWTTKLIQSNNTCITRKIKDIDNKIIAFTEFCRKYKINQSTANSYYYSKGIKTAKELLEILKKG